MQISMSADGPRRETAAIFSAPISEKNEKEIFAASADCQQYRNSSGTIESICTNQIQQMASELLSASVCIGLILILKQLVSLAAQHDHCYPFTDR